MAASDECRFVDSLLCFSLQQAVTTWSPSLSLACTPVFTLQTSSTCWCQPSWQTCWPGLLSRSPSSACTLLARQWTCTGSELPAHCSALCCMQPSIAAMLVDMRTDVAGGPGSAEFQCNLVHSSSLSQTPRIFNVRPNLPPPACTCAGMPQNLLQHPQPSLCARRLLTVLHVCDLLSDTSKFNA